MNYGLTHAFYDTLDGIYVVSEFWVFLVLGTRLVQNSSPKACYDVVQKKSSKELGQVRLTVIWC